MFLVYRLYIEFSSTFSFVQKTVVHIVYQAEQEKFISKGITKSFVLARCLKNQTVNFIFSSSFLHAVKE